MLMTFGAFLLALGLRYGTQALVATLLGDGSQARDRQLTLNPARHLSPFGVCVGLITAFSSFPVGLGWGQMIRPDARHLRPGPNSGIILIALSGIAVNLLAGIGVGYILGLFPVSTHGIETVIRCGNLQGGPLQSCLAAWQPGWLLRIEQFGFAFATVNVCMAILNVIPLYPLDMYQILFALLPTNLAISFRSSEATEELILAAILFFIPFLLLLS